MAKQTINIGTSANDRTGDPLRIAFGKINQNFTEVYNSAFSGSYEDLANTPFIPSDLADLTDNTNLLTGTSLPYLEVTNDALIVVPVNLGTPVAFARLANDSNTDFIDTELTLARGSIRGLYNSELEESYDTQTNNSPAGTEWNASGWGTLQDVRSRNYSSLYDVLNGAIGENIIGTELVMHDITNDKYYKFIFSNWGQNNGGSFAYTRTLIEDPNFFEKVDYATGNTAIDIFVEDDGQGSGIAITRGENQGIYNPYREEGWNSSVSPAGTLWNADGWDDLSNIETRTYDTFDNTYGNGGLGNNVPGAKSVMYIPDTEEYYAIQWINWTPNNAGGGFSYRRYKIDLTKINEGIKFSDGTVLKSATGLGRIKSTAPRNRRIEEVVGYKSVSVTPVIMTNIEAQASRSVDGDNRIWIDTTTTTFDEIINGWPTYDILNFTDIEFSIDNTNWFIWNGSSSGGGGNEIGYSCFPATFTYNQGDTVYMRYKSGGRPAVWWDKNELPGGGSNFRGAVIDYHAFSGEATWIGTAHIVSDTGNEHIAHTEVSSGDQDAENDDLWFVQNEGTISYRRTDGEAKTLKVHWTAKVFYGSEFWD